MTWEPHSGYTGLDRRRLDFGQADDGDKSQHQQADAGQRRSIARRMGVFFGFHDVAGGCQRKEEVSVPTRLRQDEHCVQRE